MESAIVFGADRKVADRCIANVMQAGEEMEKRNKRVREGWGRYYDRQGRSDARETVI